MHSQWRQTNEDWTDRGILSSEEIWSKMKDDQIKGNFFVWLYKQLDIKVQKMEYYLPLNDYQVCLFVFFMIYGHLSEFHVPFPSSWKLHLQ